MEEKPKIVVTVAGPAGCGRLTLLGILDRALAFLSIPHTTESELAPREPEAAEMQHHFQANAAHGTVLIQILDKQEPNALPPEYTMPAADRARSNLIRAFEHLNTHDVEREALALFCAVRGYGAQTEREERAMACLVGAMLTPLHHQYLSALTAAKPKRAQSTEPKQVLAMAMLAGGKVRVDLQSSADSAKGATVQIDIDPGRARNLHLGMWVDIDLREVDPPSPS